MSTSEHAGDLAAAKSTVNDLGEDTRGHYQQTYERLHEIFPNAAQADAVATMETLQWAANNGTGAIQSMATEGLLKGLNAVNPMVSATTMRDTTDFLEKSQQMEGIVSQTGGISSEVGAAVGGHQFRARDSGDGGLMASARGFAGVVGSEVPGMSSGATQDREANDANTFVDGVRDSNERSAMQENRSAAIRAAEHAAEDAKHAKDQQNAAGAVSAPPASPQQAEVGIGK